ncbi:MAG: two-component system C4-dicarboxylate transport response regulator DctD [Pseudohongiellaceae bacterium]|jgi:two-component system C4-dicarboxylate transport response regulator DctD
MEALGIPNKKDIVIVIVDDDQTMRESTADLLSTEYANIQTYSCPTRALPFLSEDFPGIVLSDLRMPSMNGIEFSAQLRKISPDMPIILMSAYADVPAVVNAMKFGVYDFIEKPFDPILLMECIRRAVDKRVLNLSLAHMQKKLAHHSDIETRILGNSAQIVQLKKNILSLASMDIPIMIYGETGAGKEMVARSLHDFSERAEHKFVAINCAAIPEQLAEAELFGYTKGAFTDAKNSREGKFEYAKGGTLFLDEVESLPLNTQAKLLRALSDGVVSPLGSNQEIAIDCRVISATKDELRNNENFRQDLFFRLQVSELYVPPLKDREEDILLLFEFFSLEACNKFKRDFTPADTVTVSKLLSYDWPGNVRELINVATRYALNDCQYIDIETDIPISAANTGTSLGERVAEYEGLLIQTKLREHSGKVSAVLEDLKLERRTFNKKLQRYNLSVSKFK